VTNIDTNIKARTQRQGHKVRDIKTGTQRQGHKDRDTKSQIWTQRHRYGHKVTDMDTKSQIWTQKCGHKDTDTKRHYKTVSPFLGKIKALIIINLINSFMMLDYINKIQEYLSCVCPITSTELKYIF